MKKKVVIYIPSEGTVDGSLDARRYISRLSAAVDLTTRHYDEATGERAAEQDADSLAVLAGLSTLEPTSGYVEMQLDTVFQPQEMLEKLRAALPKDFPIVVVVDDAYSDYLMSVYLKAGASAVVGTSGDLFGLVTSRLRSLEEVFPYINVFERV